MDICLPDDPTPLDRIQSFSATYTLNGEFTGEICFVDNECQEDPPCNGQPTPIQVYLPTDIEYRGQDDSAWTIPMQDCYQANPLWINGLLRTSRQQRGCNSCYSISSYFSYLTSKRIETQTFPGENLVTALGMVTDFYLALPPSLFTFLVDQQQRIRGPIVGDNAYEELRLLAQAGGSDLYVQVGGRLEMTPWKDNWSPVELVIPPGFIYTAERAEFRFGEITQVTATGATVSQIECGDRVLSTSNGDPTQTCTFAYSGIKTPTVDVTFSELLGTKEDALSSTVNLDSNATNQVFGSNADKENVKQGSFDQEIGKSDGKFIDNDGFSFDSLVTGPLRNLTDEFIFGSRNTNTFSGSFAGNRSWFNRLPSIFQDNFPTPFSLFGYGAFGSDVFIDPFFAKQQQGQDGLSSGQCSTHAVPCLISENNTGVSEETLSNKYIYKKEDLFNLSVRRIQEQILARNTWNVSLPYMPCLRLNQVIQFTLPSTQQCIEARGEKVITGIVGGIDLRYNTENESCPVEMKITVMDTSCLAGLQLQSGDLVESNCAGENSGDLSPWQTSQLGIDSLSSQVRNTLALFAAGQAQAFAFYNHTCAGPGNYTVDFDYERIQGSRTLSLSGAINGALTQNAGHFTRSFFNANGNIPFRFNVGGTGSPTYWRISNIRLVKKVTF